MNEVTPLRSCDIKPGKLYMNTYGIFFILESTKLKSDRLELLGKFIMSRSCFRMKLDFHMLDGREDCVPEMRGTSAGHVILKSGHFKLKASGPASWVFHEMDKPYDRKKWVAYAKEQLIEEFTRGNILDHVIGGLFDQAKEHCDEYHGDLRERDAKGEWTRKGH